VLVSDPPAKQLPVPLVANMVAGHVRPSEVNRMQRGAGERGGRRHAGPAPAEIRSRAGRARGARACRACSSLWRRLHLGMRQERVCRLAHQRGDGGISSSIATIGAPEPGDGDAAIEDADVTALPGQGFDESTIGLSGVVGARLERQPSTPMRRRRVASTRSPPADLARWRQDLGQHRR